MAAEAKLIEAMARAICRSRGGDPDRALTINDAHDDGRPEADVACPAWMNHREATRAALSAAEEAGYAIVPREPTEAMHEAASREDGTYDRWQAMLAASEHERRPAGEE